MNLWQRLNLALVFLILLLIIGVGLALWVKSFIDAAELQHANLLRAKDRIGYDMLLITDALRALSRDPTNEFEQRRRREAQADLLDQISELQNSMSSFPQLQAPLKELDRFVTDTGPETLGAFMNRVLEIAENDPANASTYFNNDYPTVSKQRDLLLRNLGLGIASVNTKLADRARSVSIVGLTCLVLVLLGSLLVGRFQTSVIAEPLRRLVASLEKMRQGDFTDRVALPQADEFGAVSQGLNSLAKDLSELVGQVQRSGVQVNTTTAQISSTAKEQQATAHEIAATTAEIEGASRQISTTSKELVKTMNEVNQVAEHTAGLATRGQAAIGRMETTMRQIIEACGSVTSKLAVLSEKTNNINSVVTTITKVADQTNLLSLNAAIEAEKAGEYGLGFAVVAVEIRRLADQTAVATYDIEKMVKEMQTAVAAGVMSMGKFSDEVRRGVEDVNQVSVHLAQIIHQVQALTPRFQAVNEGMQAQAAGAHQISETLTQLSEAAQQTAESLRQSNLAIEQLNSAARGLHTSVARFKLGTQTDYPLPTEAAGLGI